MRYIYSAFGCLLLCLLVISEASATHLRAGEIVAVRDPNNPLRYCFRLTTYTDNVRGKQANDAQKDVTFFFGDELTGQGGTLVLRTNGLGTDIGRETSVNYYEVCHVFSGPGTYQVRVGIQNRNDGVINLGGSSQDISFFVATTVFINPQLGFNSTPVLKNPPLDQACVGRRFIHNPAAFDVDGDSIAYRLTQPRAVPVNDLTGRGVVISGYEDPATGPRFIGGLNQDGTAPASFSINARTGDLIWDAPARAGQYNIAFIIEEWRNGIKIGEIIRDMQINVEDCDNQQPQLVIPNDTCVEAGYRFTNVLIRATDPQGSPIILTSDTTSSGVYGPNFPREWATFTPRVTPQPQPSPASGLFNWQTSCDHIRQQPYSVLFKAQDVPSNQQGQRVPLTDLKTWQITVVGPKPKNLTATVNPATRSATLNWSSYECQLPGAQIIIWRKIGCGYTPGPCERGLSPASGYVPVGSVPVSATTYTDTNNNQGLDPGVGYSYRISVQFAPPKGGASLASDEACLDLPLNLPIITHVTVDKTNKESAVADGEITVKWLRPSQLNRTLFPGPYSYRVFRATGQNGTNFTRVTATDIPETFAGQDSIVSFKDNGLNTRDSSYRYRLEFYYSNNVLLDTTAAASSVRLEASSAINAIDLTWQANVPWSNENQTHVVYRESRTQPGVYNIIAQVPVQGTATFRFRDDGTDSYAADGTQTLTLSADSVYCYKVQTVGSYGNIRVPSPLLNFSQEICASPRDTIRPCPPVLSIDTLICRDYYNNEDEPETCGGPYANNLTWTYPSENAQGIKCKEAVRFNLYYKRYLEDAFDSLPIATIPAPLLAYVHQGLTSYAGCYYLTAVDRSGNESNPSNIVCKDNCPYYELPNVFTPNGDGKNDTFEPYPCPQFVESVEFTVYNRWGRKVFETNRNILINWDGRTAADGETQGKELSSWTYYYLAKVKFQRLRRQDEVQTIKGWVQILK